VPDGWLVAGVSSTFVSALRCTTGVGVEGAGAADSTSRCTPTGTDGALGAGAASTLASGVRCKAGGVDVKGVDAVDSP
jgi:hypothetical protein